MNDLVKPAVNENQISRRDILLGLGAAVAALAFGDKAVAATPAHDHSKHAAMYPSVLEAANNCTDKGIRCVSHCLIAWKDGDLELAACANKVSEMNAICGSFARLLAMKSAHTKDYARICKAVCKECAKECQKHDKHTECRECAEACEMMVKQIDKYFA